MKIGTTKELITKLLTEQPYIRDSDNMLIAEIWKIDLEDIERAKPKSMLSSGGGVLDYLGGGDLTSPESITRCRRKIQQENPSLRGRKYILRLQQQTEVKTEIKNWNNEQN